MVGVAFQRQHRGEQVLSLISVNISVAPHVCLKFHYWDYKSNKKLLVSVKGWSRITNR